MLDALATHPVVLGVLDRVLGHYELSAPAGIAIGPGETAQPLRPDDAIYPPFIGYVDGRHPAKLLTDTR